MEAVLNHTELKIDKSTWKTVKFGDVVAEPKETCKDLLEEGIEHVVGLEHIDTGDIHLRKSATTEESTTFTKKFRKGDVLFGRRRAYLKKAAQAEFDGICSGDITVFRTKKELLPELLPFIVNNDAFFDYAVKHSAGGLSPRVKFQDLANYEFLLPPKAEQARLAELLWAMDEVIQKEKAVCKKLEKGLDTSIENQIHGIEINGKTIREVIEEIAYTKEVVHLPDLGEILKGKGIAKSEVIDEGFPCIRYGELYTKHHRIVRKYHSFVDRISADNSFKLQKNDILFASSGETITEIGKSAAFIDDIEAYAGSDTLIFRPFDMNGIFLGYLMNSQLVRQQLNKFGTGATVMHIYPSDLKMVKLPNIKREDQDKIANNLEQFSSNIDLLKAKIAASQALQKSLINQLF